MFLEFPASALDGGKSSLSFQGSTALCALESCRLVKRFRALPVALVVLLITFLFLGFNADKLVKCFVFMLLEFPSFAHFREFAGSAHCLGGLGPKA